MTNQTHSAESDKRWREKVRNTYRKKREEKARRAQERDNQVQQRR